LFDLLWYFSLFYTRNNITCAVSNWQPPVKQLASIPACANLLEISGEPLWMSDCLYIKKDLAEKLIFSVKNSFRRFTGKLQVYQG